MIAGFVAPLLRIFGFGTSIFVPSHTPGLQFTLPGNVCRFTLPDALCDFTLPAGEL